MIRKKLLLLSLVVALVAIFYGAEGLYTRYFGNGLNKPTSTYEALANKSPTFSQAERELFSDTKSNEETDAMAKSAIDGYRAALADAQNPAEEAHLKYKIAYATDVSGDSLAAIALFKQVVANDTYPAITRAYAAKYMMTMLHRNGNPKFRTEIFKDAPYAAMVVENDPFLTERYFNEYTVSLYPLAVPELNIAIWYANDIIGIGSTSTPQAKSDWENIQQKLQLANADIANTQSDPTTQLTVANGYELRAILLGKLAHVGLIPVADADAAFKKAFDFLKQINLKDQALRYNYAVYLSFFGTVHAEQIEEMLAPYINDPAYAAPFFKTERNNWMGEKEHLITLAKLDLEFKQFLLRNGWKENDFQ